jgi:hypothetical protein
LFNQKKKTVQKSHKWLSFYGFLQRSQTKLPITIAGEMTTAAISAYNKTQSLIDVLMTLKLTEPSNSSPSLVDANAFEARGLNFE